MDRNQKWKKSVVLLASIVLLCGLGFGISGASYGAEKITLEVFAASFYKGEILEKITKEFEKDHPNVTVKFTFLRAGLERDSKTEAAVSLGKPPDIQLMGQPPRIQAAKGFLQPIDEYVKKWGMEEWNDFLPAAQKAMTYQGKIFGFPTFMNTIALYWNKQLFKEAGLSRAPRTWEEYVEFGKKLTRDKDKDGKLDQWGCHHIVHAEHWWSRAQQWGAKLISDDELKFTLNSPEGRAALQYDVDLVHKHKVMALPPAGVQYEYAIRAFGSGQVAMQQSVSFDIKNIPRDFPNVDFDLAPIPAYGDQKGAVVWFNSGVVYKGAKNPELGFKFLTYFAGKSQALDWGQDMFVTARKSVAASAEIKKNPKLLVYYQQLPYTREFYYPPEVGEFSSILHKYYEAAVYGQMSAADALGKAETEINKLMEQRKDAIIGRMKGSK